MFLINVYKKYFNSNAVYNLQSFFNHFWYDIAIWDKIYMKILFQIKNLQELVMDREAWHAAVDWGSNELDTIEQLNWTKSVITLV